ncbi:MAG: MerC domain-containing protein [Bdellovibrionota bacterium]
MAQVRELIKTLKSDQLGIFLSVLCMIHCVAFPLLVAFMPAAEFFHDSYTHMGFFVLVAGLAGYSFVRGYSVHGKLKPVSLGIVGILLIMFALLTPHGHLGIFTYENLVTTLGGITLIYAHLLNIKDCRCKCCN